MYFLPYWVHLSMNVDFCGLRSFAPTTGSKTYGSFPFRTWYFPDDLVVWTYIIIMFPCALLIFVWRYEINKINYMENNNCKGLFFNRSVVYKEIKHYTYIFATIFFFFLVFLCSKLFYPLYIWLCYHFQLRTGRCLVVWKYLLTNPSILLSDRTMWKWWSFALVQIFSINI